MQGVGKRRATSHLLKRIAAAVGEDHGLLESWKLKVVTSGKVYLSVDEAPEAP